MSMNSWDVASRLADKHANQGGLFIRLTQNGDKVIGVFCGEPFARELVWTGDRYEPYHPSTHTDKRPSLRVMLNFFVPAEDDMKVIEGGTVWFKDVLKVRDKYGLDQWLFEIERHGDAGDPKTTYSILPEERVDEPLQRRIQEVGLHDLAHFAHGERSPSGVEAHSGATSPPGATGVSGPASVELTQGGRSGNLIDPRVAGELVARLKQLPRAEVDSLLSQLGVRRVRDLRASDVSKATQRLEQLEMAVLGVVPDERSHDAQADVVDPFA